MSKSVFFDCFPTPACRNIKRNRSKLMLRATLLLLLPRLWVTITARVKVEAREYRTLPVPPARTA